MAGSGARFKEDGSRCRAMAHISKSRYGAPRFRGTSVQCGPPRPWPSAEWWPLRGGCL